MATERQKEIAKLYNDASLTTAQAAAKAGISERNFLKAASRIRKAGELELIDRRARLRKGSNADQAATEVVTESLTVVEEHLLKKKASKLQAQVRELTEQQVKDSRLAGLLEQFTCTSLDVPEWLTPSKRGTGGAIASAMLSDTHFDECVNPEEINYVNAYDRQIAEMRLRTFFENVIRLDRDYISGVKTDGLVLALGGDLISGNIHDELAQSNEAHAMDTALHWSAQIAAGVELLSKNFRFVHVPSVTGNHGRNTRKPRAKGRAQDNWDYLISHMVARELRHLSNVTFDIPVGSEARWNNYKHRYHMTHGDQFRGGNGIAGVLSPIMRGDHNKRKREQSVGTPYDYLLMGHFHQLQRWGGILINGSLKGYDEYAASGNFGFEVAQQAFWHTDADHGMTMFAPVRVVTEAEKKLWQKVSEGNVADWLFSAGGAA